ncbi:hypothetical protein FFK22_002350 [Mycobacterium sp. KBS0706]|uniref:hypothetical protein n=1 Tax=Mycobacterium sp. KBS0706 TaxID=2578109 RepID=UPI001180D248|nr:hypothetical protein [Mycobacterium sp. KBS0706]TSD90311.1 hypothetical protein FFK22_002350 [Mycobacterium sp. KBS0706]
MLRSMIEVDDRTKRMLVRQQEQSPRGADAPDYALMQSRLSRSMRLSIAMTERIRVDFGMRKKKRKDSGEEERRRQRREQAAEAVAEAAAAPDVAEDVEHVRATVRETLVEDEILDAQLDSLSPEEFVREVCRKIGRPPNPDWLPRGWADGGEAVDVEPVEPVEDVVDHEPAAGWPHPLDGSDAGQPMPKPSIPDSS